MRGPPSSGPFTRMKHALIYSYYDRKNRSHAAVLRFNEAGEMIAEGTGERTSRTGLVV